MRRSKKNKVSDAQRKLDAIAAMVMSAQLNGRFGSVKLEKFFNESLMIGFDIGTTKFSVVDAGGTAIEILIETEHEIIHTDSAWPEDLLIAIDTVINASTGG